ncbi:hypothetical protein [Nonomuraea cypriaca]|nr:hypothetical protein [Nonomuraea cypriaca]
MPSTSARTGSPSQDSSVWDAHHAVLLAERPLVYAVDAVRRME